MAEGFQVGMVGAAVIITCSTPAGVIIDLSSASGLEMEMRRPDGTTLDKAATLHTDGTDGKLKYLTLLGDFNGPGEYFAQGRFTRGSFTGPTQQVSFKVFANVI